MDTPADTWMYFIAGYAVILSSLAVYVISLVIRWKRLKEELKRLSDETLADTNSNQQPTS
jgi:hypothetical protein